tara:strand:- start:6085 stop:16080 length:9996 start_codon:yes stop_codon:yes gene_type:complete
MDNYKEDKKDPAMEAAKQRSQEIARFVKENRAAPNKGIGGHVRDLGLAALSSAVSVPELAVGIADIPTGGRVGKFLENEGGSLGFRPAQAKEAIAGAKTERTQEQLRDFQNAQGFGAKFGQAIDNPSLITNTVVESLAPMLAGGVVGRGLGAVAPKLSPVAAGALGEGAVGAGLAAEQIRQQTDDGLLTGKQAGLAAATGATTAGFGFAGGRVAQKLGIGDVDTMIAGGTRSASGRAATEGAEAANQKNVVRRVLEGAASEGVLEELPQSISETVLQNIALGNPIEEGVDDAAVLGLLSGAAMGGFAGGITRNRKPDSDITPTEDMGQEAPRLGLPNPNRPGGGNQLGYQGAISDPNNPNWIENANPDYFDRGQGPDASRMRNLTPDPELPFNGELGGQFSAAQDGTIFTEAEYNDYLAQQQAQARAKRDAGLSDVNDVTPVPQGYDQFGGDPRLTAPRSDFEVTPDGTARTSVDSNTALQQERAANAERLASRLRGDIQDNTPVPSEARGFGDLDSIDNRKPSERMGLDPNKGGLSAAAAIAVDSGASPAAAAFEQASAPTQSAWQKAMSERMQMADQSSPEYQSLAQAMANEPTSVPAKNKMLRDAAKLPSRQVDSKAVDPKARVIDESRAQTKAYTPKGNEVQAQWDVVDASQLITSNTDTFTPNPDFPSDRQPRDRTRAGSQKQVNDIANKLQPNMLGESSDISTGSPFIGPNDNVVDSGNGRTMAIRRAYKEGGEKAQAYRQFVSESAGKYGLDTNAVNNMQAPVLVRRNMSNMDRNQFASEANQTSVARMSSTEQAATDAKQLPDASLLSFGSDGAMNLYQSSGYIKNFIAGLPSTEQASMMDDNGALSQEGKRRVEAAIIQDAYDAPNLVTAISETLGEGSKNILKVVTDKAPQISQINNDAKSGDAYENTLSKDIADAAQAYMDITKSGQDVESYLSQDALFDDGLSAGAKDILKSFYDNRRSAKAMGENIQERINQITGRGNPKQGGLSFDDDIETPVQTSQAPQVSSENGSPVVQDLPATTPEVSSENSQTKYRLPTKEESYWKLSQPSTERESVLVDAVSQALDEGVVYNKDLNKRVAEILNIPQSILDVNTRNTENGDFGYDVFNARKKVEANNRDNGNNKARERLKSRLSVGRNIGTIVIDNGKTLRRATIESMDDKSIKIAGTTGSKRLTYGVNYSTLEDAIKRAEDEGKREKFAPPEVATAVTESEATPETELAAKHGFNEGNKLDHGELSIPNRTKNIDNELNKYKADKAKLDAKKRDEVKAKNTEKADAEKARLAPIQEQAQAEYKQYGTAMVSAYKDRLEAQGVNARDFIRDEAKYNPESFLKLSKKFQEEQQAATQAPVEAAPETKKPATKKADKPAVTTEPVAEIEDFGEKITGARKDMDSFYQKEITDDDILSQPLSKIWPKKDIDAIEDKKMAALATVLRGTIPNKPRKGYKLNNWVAQVKSARGIMQQMLSDDASAETFINQMTKVKGLQSTGYHAQLLSAIEQDQWARVTAVDHRPYYAIQNDDGSTSPDMSFDVTIDKRRHIIPTENKQISEVVDKVNELLSGEVKTQALKFDLYSRGRGDKRSYFITQASDKDKTPLIEFNDRDAARAFLRDNNNDLSELWNQHKEKVNVKKTDTRSKQNRERIGPDHRGGQDVTTEQFMEAFGLRGGQFGNWVKQGANTKERQGMLNDAYDAFMDLANLLNIPSEAIGLGGKLGMSFGARGKGAAMAHYEPSQVVINLTKTKGAGTLAHEWFHALDHHFTSFRDSPARNKSREDTYITYKPEPSMMYTPQKGRGYLISKPALEKRRAKSNDPMYNAENWAPDPNHPAGVRPKVEEAFADLVNALNDSPMKERANTIDKGATDGYWSRIIERAARAFESYVINKLDKQGARSDFLANVTPEDAFPRNMDRYPYLLESEMAPVAEAFDNLFATIDSKASEDGNGKTLFSRAGQMSQTIENVKAGAIGSTNTTRQQVINKLSSKFGKETINNLIADGKLDIKVLSDFVRNGRLTIPSDVDGLYLNGKATLIADNLSDEMIIPTFLHELGGHGGMQTLMDKKAYNALMKDFDALVAAGDPLAVHAKTIADKVARSKQEALDEYLPYLLTLASRQQVRQGKIAGMINRMVMAVRSFLRNMLGVSIRINSQDILSLAERMVNEVEKQSSAFGAMNAMPQFSDPKNPDMKFSSPNVPAEQVDDVRTPAFKKWFGESKVVDSSGDPLVVYHGTIKEFNEFNTTDFGALLGKGSYFTASEAEAAGYSGGGKRIVPAYLSIENPYYVESGLVVVPSREQLAKDGYDGVIYKANDGSVKWAVAHKPTQIKSATNNTGAFDGSNPDIRFSRAAGATDQFDPKSIARESMTRFYDWVSSAPPGKLSWWHKTIGTMYNLAQRNPYFKPVFESTEKFINDVSFYASKASELAPRLLPQLDSIRDITKSAIGAKDNEALSKPIFEGTLLWGRDLDGKAVLIEDWRKKVMAASKQDRLQMLKDANRITPAQLQELATLNNIQANRFINGIIDEEVNAGLVWTDNELRSKFDLSDEQIGLYREFRAATDNSLDSMTRSDMLRRLGKDAAAIEVEVMEAGTLREAVFTIEQHINALINDAPKKEKSLRNTFKDIKESQFRTNELMDNGYAPLSRFGQYTVDVVDADGNREYFGMFESAYEARKMEAEMKALYDGDGYEVSRGALSNEEFKLFAGVTPETAELFGEMMGLDATGDKAADDAFQEYLRRTKNNRSTMKRLMHRKGIKGYSEDVGRVLASFIYSNARHTSAALNMGNLDRSIQDIPKGEGQLKDAAVKLAQYIKNPQEEGQLIRGWMFAQYLGGSIASAVVNITQPIAVSFPYLSQFGGGVKAAAELSRSSSDWAKSLKNKNNDHFEADLQKAIERAEADGTLSPQEVHNLLKQASGKNPLQAGDGTKYGDGKAALQNTFSRISLGWGTLFSLAEQINRRVTFVAAYRMAKEQGMADPADFATKSIKETQFVYNKASRMNWGRGAVGGTLMTFKTYTVSYMELMHRLWTQGDKGSQERAQGRKAAMLMMGTLFMLGGAGGLPFMEDIEDVIDGAGQIMGYNFSTRKSRQDFLDAWLGELAGDFIESGISSIPGSPTDVSGRLGMDNLIPGTGIFKERTDNTRDALELLGPAGDFSARMLGGSREILKGVANVDGRQIRNGALELSPVAVRNAAKGAGMLVSGTYKDTKGYKVSDVTPIDAVFKGIGFQPKSVSKIQQANYLGQSSTSYYNLRASDIRALWAAGVSEGNQAKVADARAAVADWNKKNPEQPIVIKPNDIARRVREMNMDKSDRVVKLAPKSMRGQMAQDFAQVREGL